MTGRSNSAARARPASTRACRRRSSPAISRIASAIVAGSDLAAFGAIRALQHAGRKVYDDVAVIGFDDIREAVEHDPPLTTGRQPIADLGSTMTRMLLDRLADRAPRRSAVLPVELVLRATA